MQKAAKKKMKASEFLLNYALYIILITILVVVCIIDPSFLSMQNILAILKQASTKGILALGVAGLIVLAGTDLSIGRVVGLSAAVTASLVQSVTYSARYFPQMTKQLPLIVPLLAAIAVAVIFTLINGFGVAYLKMHAFIITLGTQLIAYGCNCLFIEAQPSGSAQALSTFESNFKNKAAGSINVFGLKIPLVVIYFLIIACIMWVIWNRTRLGKNMFAVGGNMEAAAVSGVNVPRTIMLVFLMAGILYFALFGYRLLPDAKATGEVAAQRDYSDVPLWKQVMSLVVLLVVILAMIFEDQIGIKIQVSACLGAIVLVLFGVISEKAALASIDLKVVLLFGGSLALATALDTTGAGTLIADTIVHALGADPNPIVILLVIFVVGCVLTNFMSNTATTALMVPIATSLAQSLGADPRAMIIATVIACSCAYATPIGMPANTMVVGLGGYKFNDYVKSGLPLIAVSFVICMVLLPILYPFFP